MTFPAKLDDRNAFLFFSKERLLREIHGEFESHILETLESAGIHTYGEFLEYAIHHHFSDLPGIGSHKAEKLHQLIQFTEDANKQCLLVKYLATVETFSNIKQVAEAQLQDKSISTSLTPQ